MPLAAAAILRCVLKDDVFPMLVRVRFLYRRCLCTAIGGVAIFFLACFESNLSQTERLSGLELGHLLSLTTVTDTFPIQLDHFTSSPAMAKCGTFLVLCALLSVALGANEPTTEEDHNLAYEYAADYHVAFATIGFTTIVLLLTVFGVSVAMWNIDPGRDSIIYRLTAQKMKKDQ
ncbi:Renin receptor [Tyrophagus putrescentiae]|nr:Renin receptor [Tyrophagus putrescentiae]